MRYYIIAGEASGDLHAAHLMLSLKETDPEAEFRFFGGDNMSAAGGTCVKHYRELAYMGFVPVLLHLRTIFRNMALCKRDIADWRPDAVILVDYPGFNLSIAKFVHAKTSIPVYYYISPKIWAWKEYRIKNIKRDVDELFSILPFEVPFFEQKHRYPIHYVGNPTADEVREFRNGYNEAFNGFTNRHGLDNRPIIALLAGSRKQEIKDNLPAMAEAAIRFSDRFQLIIAGAPSIDHDYYEQVLAKVPALAGTGYKARKPRVIHDDTYALLANSEAALVTSGTATLETALFDVPQVVCYETPLPRLISFLRRHIIKVRYISLVNLIADREIVRELVADTFTVENIADELDCILHEKKRRDGILEGYKEIRRLLGDTKAPDNAAKIITSLLKR